MSGILDGQILPSNKIEKVRSSESRFVPRIEDGAAIIRILLLNPRLKELFETADKVVRTAGQLNKMVDIVVCVEAVSPWIIFVVRILLITVATMEGSVGIFETVVVEASLLCITWNHEAREILTLLFRVPVVPPIAGAMHILRDIISRTQATSNLRHAEIIDSVSHRPRNRTRKIRRNISELLPIRQRTAALFSGRIWRSRIVVVWWCDFSVLLNSCVSVLPIDLASYAFDIRICQNVVAVRAALHCTVEVGRAGVR